MRTVLTKQWCLLFPFAALLGAVFAVVFSICGVTASEAVIAYLNQVRLPAIHGLHVIDQGRLKSTQAVLDALLLEHDDMTPGRFDAVIETRRRAWAEIRQGWTSYERLPPAPAMAGSWSGFLADWTAWSAVSDSMGATIEAMGRNEDRQRQKALFVTLSHDYAASLPLAAALDQSLSQLRQLRRIELEVTFAARSAALSHARYAVMAMVVVLTFVATAIMWRCLRRFREASAQAIARRSTESDDEQLIAIPSGGGMRDYLALLVSSTTEL